MTTNLKMKITEINLTQNDPRAEPEKEALTGEVIDVEPPSGSMLPLPGMRVSHLRMGYFWTEQQMHDVLLSQFLGAG